MTSKLHQVYPNFLTCSYYYSKKIQLLNKEIKTHLHKIVNSLKCAFFKVQKKEKKKSMEAKRKPLIFFILSTIELSSLN